MITKEKLQERLDTYKSQREQLTANANALAGAIQILEQVLIEFDTPEPDAPSE